MTKIERMAIAMMEFEGYSKGSISYDNNNPGNLKFHGQLGATGVDQFGHAIFSDFRLGWDALIHQITIAVAGQSHVYKPTDTIRQFFGKYSTGNQEAYANFVAQRLAISPTTQLMTLKG